MEHSSHRPTGHDASENELFRQLEAGIKEECTPLTNALLAHDENQEKLQDHLDAIMRGEGGCSQSEANYRLDRVVTSNIRTYDEVMKETIGESPDPLSSLEHMSKQHLQYEAQLLTFFRAHNPDGDYYVTDGAAQLEDYLASAESENYRHAFATLLYRSNLQHNIATCLQAAEPNKSELIAQTHALEEAFNAPASNAPCYEKAAYKIKSAARVAKSALESAIEKRKFRQAARAVKK